WRNAVKRAVEIVEDGSEIDWREAAEIRRIAQRSADIHASRVNRLNIRAVLIHHVVPFGCAYEVAVAEREGWRIVEPVWLLPPDGGVDHQHLGPVSVAPFRRIIGGRNHAAPVGVVRILSIRGSAEWLVGALVDAATGAAVPGIARKTLRTLKN